MPKVKHPYRCPTCHTLLDAADEFDYERQRFVDYTAPTPNSLTVCAYCAELLIYTPTLAVRKLTADEWIELPVDLRSTLTRIITLLTERKLTPPASARRRP